MKNASMLVQEHRVEGERLLARVKELVHEGNVRRIIIKDEAGVALIEVPLTVGVMGAVLLPVWVALGAIAAVSRHYRIVVEARPVTDDLPDPALAGSARAFHARPDV